MVTVLTTQPGELEEATSQSISFFAGTSHRATFQLEPTEVLFLSLEEAEA